MLKALHIRNYVLIDSVDIEFQGSLEIISGPTGAGKSILTGALGLLSGKKADSSVISSGSDNCVVEGEFIFQDGQFRQLCRENDVDYNGGALTIRRVVSRSGRSRAFINDEPVSLAVLEEVGSHLIDIHSQHDTLLLTSKSYQLSVLDAFAGNGELLKAYFVQYSLCRELRAGISRLKEELDRARSENEYNREMYRSLCDAHISEGEIAALEEEQYSLSHSEQIKELTNAASEMLDSTSPGQDGLNAGLSALSRCLDNLAGIVPSFGEYAKRLEAVRIEVKDIAEDISRANDRIDCSPQRLEWVDGRLAQLYSLMKRHGVDSESQLLAKQEEFRRSASGCEDMADEINAMEIKYAQAEKEASLLAGSLTERRTASAVEFASSVQESLSFMELDKAVFRVDCAAVAPGPSGADELTFMFSANGTAPAPLAKCASGGEMSRIMLALKQIMSKFMNMPTVILDEIDTGVSGSVADRMGTVIQSMGKTMQVFAITHLPQVASKGDSHYLVEKSAGEQVISTITKLSAEQRVLEIARMLSGSSLSEEALANARALLQN